MKIIAVSTSEVLSLNKELMSKVFLSVGYTPIIVDATNEDISYLTLLGVDFYLFKYSGTNYEKRVFDKNHIRIGRIDYLRANLNED